jgi:subtilisin family serine protease
VQYALDNGVHVVFAAGNGNTTTAWPPMTEGVIAVAAIDSNGIRSTWGFQASNYGPWIELSAGGTGVPVMTTNGFSTTSDGTSFACPNVVGVGCLVLSEAPNLSTDDLIAVLQEGSVSIDALNPAFAGQLGTGHVNAFLSLRLLKPVDDLGGAFGGPKLPVLNAWGGFGPGKQMSLSVSRARASSAGALVIGFTAANLPLFGGVLVPSADFVVTFVTSGKGAAKKVIPFTAPLPSGTQLRAQAGVLDGSAPQGVALTNALLLSVP